MCDVKSKKRFNAYRISQVNARSAARQRAHLATNAEELRPVRLCGVVLYDICYSWGMAFCSKSKYISPVKFPGRKKGPTMEFPKASRGVVCVSRGKSLDFCQPSNGSCGDSLNRVGRKNTHPKNTLHGKLSLFNARSLIISQNFKRRSKSSSFSSCTKRIL